MVQFLPTLRALACKHSQSFLRVGLECSFKSKLRQSCHYSFWCNTPGRLSVSAEPRAFLFKWNTGYCPASSVRSTRSLHNSTILQCSKVRTSLVRQTPWRARLGKNWKKLYKYIYVVYSPLLIRSQCHAVACARLFP